MSKPKTLDEILGQASGGAKGGASAAEPVRTLTEEHKKMILALIANKNQLKMDGEAIRDDTKAIADKLGLKTGEINRVVTLVSQEQEKGGALNKLENVIDLANQVLGQVDSGD
jgi:hypothetical protein